MQGVTLEPQKAFAEFFDHPPQAKFVPPFWFRGWRPGQEEAVEEVVAAFGRGAQVVLLDAPTGTGKTLIADAVRQQLEIKTTLYCCHSLDLQDQFARDFPTAVIKGRRNYHSMTSGIRADSCDRMGTDTCSFCPVIKECPYEIAKLKALIAPLACANLYYFLTVANWQDQFRGRELVVLDEATKIEGELARFIEITLPKGILLELGLNPPTRRTVERAWAAWRDEALPVVKKAAREAQKHQPLNPRRFRILSSLAENLATVELDDGNWVYSGYDTGKVEFRPIRVSHLTERFLWRHGKKFLLMDAAFISAEQTARDLGLERWEVVSIRSSFPRARRPICIRRVVSMDHKTTKVTKRQNWIRMALEIARVMEDWPTERILLHSVSYAFSHWLVDFLASPRIVWYGAPRERKGAISRFRGEVGSVLVAPSLERGLDLPGHLCRVVVVPKMPNPDLGDKVVSRRFYGTADGRIWYHVQAVRSLVQMTGRGMRSAEDWCVTYVLDDQFTAMVWAKSRDLLPSWWQEAIDWSGGTQGERLRREVNGSMGSLPS